MVYMILLLGTITSVVASKLVPTPPEKTGEVLTYLLLMTIVFTLAFVWLDVDK